MPRLAVVLNGTELARQTDAEVTGVYGECCARLSDEGSSFSCAIFTDESIRFLLDGLDPAEFACVAFASNALTSTQIGSAVKQRQLQLQKYVTSGGALLVLHQLVDELTPLLPRTWAVTLTDRRSPRGNTQVLAADSDDVLLNHPTGISLERFVDGGFASGPPSLFYKSFELDSLSEQLKPVLLYGREVLLARTYDHIHGRVVLSTLALDWQRQTGLLENAIRFACRGAPHRLVWREESHWQREPAMRWLASDGKASIHAVPAPDVAIRAEEQWLLRHVDVAVVPQPRRDDIESRDEVQQFLVQGGTLLAFDDRRRERGSEVNAVVGGYTERRLARQLFGELRAVRGWDRVDYAFELRNIVTCLHFLATNPGNLTGGAVRLHELADLVPQLKLRLSDRRHREDLSSSIAHAQSLAFLCGSEPVDQTLLQWMSGDPRCSRADVALQVRAVGALGQHAPDPEFVTDALVALSSGGTITTLPGVIRVLDALAVLDQAGQLSATPAAAVAALSAEVCRILDQFENVDEVGWLSIEATADAARGLVALLDSLSRSDDQVGALLAQHISSAGAVLRPALAGYERDRKAVAWLARVTHAVVLIDRRFPIGLQRLATLAWPEASADELSQASGAERSLIEHLALENKQLREKERELQRSRLASMIGRASATLAAVALITAPLALLVVRLGWDSVWTLVANLAVVAAVILGLVSFAFSWLDKRALLAKPAAKIHKAATDALGAVAAVTKLKPK